MRHSINAKNCRVEVINHPQDDQVYLNISDHRLAPDGLQIVLSKRVANALALLMDDST